MKTFAGFATRARFLTAGDSDLPRDAAAPPDLFLPDDDDPDNARTHKMFSRSSLALAPVRTALSTRSLTRSASTAARSATASSRATSSSVRFGVAAFGAAAFLGAATLAAPVHLDGEAKPKRRSYNERMKRTGDGKVVIQRPVEVEEEVDAEEEATSGEWMTPLEVQGDGGMLFWRV